jgi:hypothetical protein
MRATGGSKTNFKDASFEKGMTMIGKMMKSVWISVTMALLLMLSAVPAYADHEGPGEGEELGVDVTIDSVARQRGVLVVTGTIACEQAAEAEVYVGAMQAVGRWHVIYGSGPTDMVQCKTTSTQFTTRIAAETGGKFQGGRVQVFAEAFACSPNFPDYEQYMGEEPNLQCGWNSTEITTKVRAARR